MSFQYPFAIARDVVLFSRSLPSEAFEAHGVGILEKVFDIGCSLADILLLQRNRIQVSSLEIGPRDYLMELVGILGTCFGGSSKCLGMLAAKAEECLHVKIKRTLSESETSNKLVVIEEINNDEDNYEREDNGETFYGSSPAVEIQDAEVVADIPDGDLSEKYSSSNSLSPTNLSYPLLPLRAGLEQNLGGGFDGY